MAPLRLRLLLVAAPTTHLHTPPTRTTWVLVTHREHDQHDQHDQRPAANYDQRTIVLPSPDPVLTQS